MNKGDLRAHFLALLNRTDCTNALADTFIDQSIARIQRSLRIPPMEKTARYTIAVPTSLVTIPADFLEIMDLYHENTNLQRIPLARMVEYSASGEQGTPRFFSRQGDEILIFPFPTSGTLTLNYYAQFTEMVNDSDENDLAIIASDLITYGALSYASDYFLDERGQIFEMRFNQFMTEVQGQADDAEMSGTVQAILPTSSYEV